MLYPILEFIVCMAVLVAVACRLNQLTHRVTYPRVVAQFFLLGFGSFGSGLLVVVSHPAAMLPLGVSVLVFLWLGASRWERGAPPGTSRPMPFDEVPR